MSVNNTTTLTSLFSVEVANALAVFVGSRDIIPLVANAANGIATSISRSIDTEVSSKLNEQIVSSAQYPSGLYNPLNTNSNNVSQLDISNSFPDIITQESQDIIIGTAISRLYSDVIQNFPGAPFGNISLQTLSDLIYPIISGGVVLSMKTSVSNQVTDMFSKFIAPNSEFFNFDFELPSFTFPDIDNPQFPSVEIEDIIDDVGAIFDSILIGDDGPPVTDPEEEAVDDFAVTDIGFDEVDYAGAAIALQNSIEQAVSGEFNFISAVDDAFDSFTSKMQQEAAVAFSKETAAFDPFQQSNLEKLQSNKVGFRDPDAVFPSVDYQGQPETNRLARGVVSQTIVQEKFDNRLTGAPLPNNGSFSEPVSTFKARYPYNSVTETLSGHIIELDDTPGSERIHIYHKSGSYHEIDAVGNIYHRAKGSEYVIVDRNGYLSVAGDYNVSLSGNLNIRVCDNANIEVDGDAIINGYNNVEVSAAGRLKLSGGEAVDIRAPNIYIQADDALHITADNNIRFKVGSWDDIVTGAKYSYVVGDESTFVKGKANRTINGDSTEKYALNKYVQVAKNLELKIGSKVIGKLADKLELEVAKEVDIIAMDKVSFKATKDINIQTDKAFTVKASEDIKFDSATYYKFDSGTSPDAVDEITDLAKLKDGKSPNAARYSLAGLITARKDIVRTEISDVFADNFVDSATYTTDDVPESSTEVNKGLVDKGYIQGKELEEKPVKTDSDDKPRAVAVSPVAPNAELKNLAEVPPDNFMLSPHFNLGMLSSKAPAQPHRVQSQLGLSVGDIVSNLQDVALNVLEPLYVAYPNLLVTSGFRRVEASKNSGSVHPLGLAVDIQFKGVSESEYYGIAQKIKSLISNYDQILLEYKSTGSKKPWIHIAVKNKASAQRVQNMTFFNHAKHSDGFVNLVA